jgi:hypothetical protein
MKLIRHGAPDHEIPGLLLNDGRRIDASGFGSDYDEAFFGGDGLERLAQWAEAILSRACFFSVLLVTEVSVPCAPHLEELRHDWDRARQRLPLLPIPPLE